MLSTKNYSCNKNTFAYITKKLMSFERTILIP